MVTLLSEENRRRSNRAETLLDTTKGSTELPSRYAFMPVASRTVGVVSKPTPPSRLFEVSDLSSRLCARKAHFVVDTELSGTIEIRIVSSLIQRCTHQYRGNSNNERDPRSVRKLCHQVNMVFKIRLRTSHTSKHWFYSGQSQHWKIVIRWYQAK